MQNDLKQHNNTKHSKHSLENTAEENKGEKDKKQEEKKIVEQEQQDKIQELTQLLQRLQADFDNFRKRSEKKTQESLQQGTIDVITMLLPILDSFELALKNCSKEDEISKGFELIYLQLYDLLKNFGLQTIDAINVTFDPYKHEAIQRVVNNERLENTVVEIFQKGYVLNGYMLRYAKVKVSVHEHEITSN